ncbi:hypothetical protein PVAG01_03994 [Phlyctema vagabunda]|uniref:Uncharacterized protein n=1 Tax=Phlyctema vagabunda TaxID=108571 RepID=A0ABR4PN03_9HELO
MTRSQEQSPWYRRVPDYPYSRRGYRHRHSRRHSFRSSHRVRTSLPRPPPPCHHWRCSGSSRGSLPSRRRLSSSQRCSRSSLSLSLRSPRLHPRLGHRRRRTRCYRRCIDHTSCCSGQRRS